VIEWPWNLFLYLWEKGFTLLTDLYGLTLRFFLWNFATQILAVVIAVVALVGGIYLVMIRAVGFEFFPKKMTAKLASVSKCRPAPTCSPPTRWPARLRAPFSMKCQKPPQF